MDSSSMPSAVEAVLWDLDATIIDTESQLDSAIHGALATLLTDKTRQPNKLALEKALAMSRGGADKGAGSWPSVVLQCLGLSDISEGSLHDATYEIFNQTLHSAQLMPGALDCIENLAKMKMPQCIVTSGTRTQTEKKRGFLPQVFCHMQRVVTVDDVSPLFKPAPLPYLLAASALNVNVNRCIAVEDSIPGITSAAAAGAFIIAVPLPIHRAQAALIVGDRGIVLESLLQWNCALSVLPPTGLAQLSGPLPECTVAYLASIGEKSSADAAVVEDPAPPHAQA